MNAFVRRKLGTHTYFKKPHRPPDRSEREIGVCPQFPAAVVHPLPQVVHAPPPVVRAVPAVPPKPPAKPKPDDAQLLH